MSPASRLLAHIALVALLLAGCGHDAPAPPLAPPTTARAYDLEGRPLRDLPRIRGWCVAVIASHAPAPWPIEGRPYLVLPSPERWTNLASLLTGLMPSRHGVDRDGSAPSGYARAWTTAAEVLAASYDYETVAFTDEPWPAAGTALLQGFARVVSPETGRGEPGAAETGAPKEGGPGGVGVEVERWRATRAETRPFFAFVLESSGEPPSAVRASLRAAAGARPLLLLHTHVAAPTHPGGAQPLFAEHTILTSLTVEAPPGAEGWRSGASQRGLLDGVLARLGAPPLPGGGREHVEPRAAPIAEFEASSPRFVLAGLRGPQHSYWIDYDMLEGTVKEFLEDRVGRTTAASGDGPLPSAGLDAAFCAAVEGVRDRLWGQVDDVAWRIASSYVSGLKAVPTKRPPPLCSAAR